MGPGCHLAIFFSFGTQGLALIRQMLYYLNHIPTIFCFSYLSDKVSCFLYRLAADYDPFTYACHIAGIAAV
jgi:hypothetical protein